MPGEVSSATPETVATQRGIALLVALLVVAILMVIIYQFTYTTTIDLKLVRNQSLELKSYYAARGVVALARAHLRDDLVQDGGLFAPDSYLDGWAAGDDAEASEAAKTPGLSQGGVFNRSIGEVALEYEIVDEARKICVNNLALEQLSLAAAGQAESPREVVPREPESGDGPSTSKPDPEALAKERREMTKGFIRQILIQLDADPDEAERLVEAIEDGAPYASLQELARIDGMRAELPQGRTDDFGRKPGLQDFLTVYSMGEININTAPRQVLIAILSGRYGGRASEFADAIIDFRTLSESGVPADAADEDDAAEGAEDAEPSPTGGVFTSVDDLARQIPGLEDLFGGTEDEDDKGPSTGDALRRQLTIWSRFFSVRVTAGEIAPRKEYTFVMKRGLTPDIPLPVLLWEERNLPAAKDETAESLP